MSALTEARRSTEWSGCGGDGKPVGKTDTEPTAARREAGDPCVGSLHPDSKGGDRLGGHPQRVFVLSGANQCLGVIDAADEEFRPCLLEEAKAGRSGPVV